MNNLLLRHRALNGVATRRLPAEYQEVEWVHSSGWGNYFDTLEDDNKDNVITIKFLTAKNDDRPFSDNSNSESHRYFQLYNNRPVYDLWGSRIFGASEILPLNTLRTLEFGNFYVKNIEDNLNFTGQYVDFDTSYTLRFPSQSNTSMYIYYIGVKRNGVQINDLIPCYRKSDEKVGMYDLVSGHFYETNFTKGADVN